HRSERRHQDDRGRRMHRARGAQDVHAVAAAHLQVAQHDVEVAVVQALDRRVAVRSFLDLVARLGQPARQPAPERVVIIGNENATHTDTSRYLNQPDAVATGSVTRNRVPASAALFTSIRPSWASTIFRTMASPRPVPVTFVVKKGLKILSATSAVMPGPSSVTSITMAGV